jgi:hypothetical protein
MTADSDVRIERIRVSELGAFAAEATRPPRDGGVVPVSRVRAAAQAKNPHAQPDDVGLLVAYSRNICVGYLGLLPALFRVEGASHPMSWLSTWHVAPEHRRLAAGAKLMLHAMRLGRDVAVTGFAPTTASVYTGLRWKALGPLRSPVLRLNRINVFAAPFLALRRRLGRNGVETPFLDRALPFARAPLKRIFYQLALASLRSSLEAITLRDIARVDDAGFEREDDRIAPVRFFRGASTINWMLENPWTVTDRAKATPGYFFSELARFFRYAVVEIQRSRDGRNLGFLVIAIVERGDTRSLVVLDDHVYDLADKPYALAATMRLAARDGADTVSVPREWRPSIARSPVLSAAFGEGEVAYFRWGGILAPAAARVRLALSDGDLPFS